MSEENINYNLDEVKELLKASEKEYKEEVKRVDNIPFVYKQMRKGVFLFIFFHLMIEIIITQYDRENAKYMGIMLLANYHISRGIIRTKANNDKLSGKENLFYYGFFISLMVFIVRLILGYVVGYLIFRNFI